MKIDCSECGAEDKVWASKIAPGRQAVARTLEVGRNAVTCRGCKREGYVDLDVTCANCQGSDLWRWPNRSMDTNTRRWMCRDCFHVTEVHDTAVMYTSVKALPVVRSRGRTTPNCDQCSHPTVMHDRDRMTSAYCRGPVRHLNSFYLHKQKKADIKKGTPPLNNTTFFPTVTSANSNTITINGEQVSSSNTNSTATFKSKMKTFKELRKARIASIMRFQHVSKDIAKMIFQLEWEALDDEAILSV
ncbi:hypothetical protein HWD16_gp13 [Microbacterium phage Arete]|uniref:Uncharacterized protein n=1 Tax=Microbacterium phage Arete TaxID=2713257 RepID=A0A6G8R143_9CAUD|nr:hypothetical protein HWD16_gp13 [Microbacterium phage Arete]QIN93896.1 hypothetical protein SEA_ARETE_13 [Microbacterium phage Arete]